MAFNLNRYIDFNLLTFLWNTDLGGEVRQEGDVHLLTLNREVLVEALSGAFREVDSGLVFLRGDTHADDRLHEAVRSKVSDCLLTVWPTG